MAGGFHVARAIAVAIALALLTMARNAPAQTADSDSLLRVAHLFARADSIAGSGRDPERLLRAIAIWRQVVPIFEASTTRNAAAVSLSRIARAYEKMDARDSALVYHRRALALNRELGDRLAEAKSLNGIGEAFYARAQLDSALAYFTIALPILREVGNRQGEGIAYGNIGGAFNSMGRADTALVYFGRALSIARNLEDRTGEGSALGNIGAIFIQLGHPDSALAYFGSALAIAREIGDREGEATTLGNIGTVHHEQGRSDSAVVYYTRALAIERAVGDRRAEAGLLANLGAVQSAIGQPDSALAYYARAQVILRDVGDREGEATTYNNIGHVYSTLGGRDSALVYYWRAATLFRNIGDRHREALALSNIGAVFRFRSQFDSALAYFGRALPIQRDAGDRRGEAAVLFNIGLAQDALLRPDSALVYFSRALAIERELGDRAAEAGALDHIGQILTDAGMPDSALAFHVRALPIRREARDREGEGQTLNHIGLARWSMGQLDSALVYLRTALSIQREVRSGTGESAALHNIGLVFRALERPDSALAYFRRSLSITRDIGDRWNESVTLNSIGVTHLRSADVGSALAAAAAFDTAAAVRARVRQSAGGDANAVSLGEAGGYMFGAWSRAWARIAATAKDSTARARALLSSLAAAERGRAQALRDLLDRQPRIPNAGEKGLFPSDTTPGADLALEATRLLAPMRASHAALLYYLSDGDTLRAWFVSAHGELRALPPMVRPRGELASTIALARTMLGANGAAARRGLDDGTSTLGVDSAAARATTQVSAATESTDALTRLSADVLPPELEALLHPDEELVIVPHGAIGQVPFAALALRGDTMPLGMRNPIRYAPSLRALAAAEATRAPSPRRALVVGNPSMPLVRTVSGATRRLVPLDGAEEEARWIARQLGTQALIGRAASETAVRRLLPRATVVHLATHGLAYGTESRVRDSYVALAPGTGDDGLLTLGELLDDDALQLSADLIVLSACQTGLGEAREAEGTVGLQRGLLARGARSVLVSLWSVDDEATRALMERFYTHWLGTRSVAGVSKAEALRRAERDVRSDRAHADWRKPRFWAAFQLVGAH